MIQSCPHPHVLLSRMTQSFSSFGMCIRENCSSFGIGLFVSGIFVRLRSSDANKNGSSPLTRNDNHHSLVSLFNAITKRGLKEPPGWILPRLLNSHAQFVLEPVSCCLRREWDSCFYDEGWPIVQRFKWTYLELCKFVTLDFYSTHRSGNTLHLFLAQALRNCRYSSLQRFILWEFHSRTRWRWDCHWFSQNI